MPIYEFSCACGKHEEKLVPMGTKEITCPSCGKTMSKEVSLSSFQLQGSGWAFDSYGLKTTKKKNS